MLTTLSIRNVVLIDKLDIDFRTGLNGLTGETGAGKSILLDAMGLALGERAEARLVSEGASQASVTATFDGIDAVVRPVLDEHGLEPPIAEEGLILRRVLGADGKSRAFVNGESVTVAALRALGRALADIHGQFDNQRLLEPSQHRDLVDAYGGHDGALSDTESAWADWRTALKAAAEAEARFAKARADEDFLRHAVGEIDELDPKDGEEDELSQRRALLMNAEKIAEGLTAARTALAEPKDVGDSLRKASAEVERLATLIGGGFDGLLATLDRAANDADEALAEIDRRGSEGDLDPRELETVEERLFAFRALARKHGVEVAELPALRDRLAGELAGIEDGDAAIEALRSKAAAAKTRYEKAAATLTKARTKAASTLAEAVMAELPQLKLGDARFTVLIDALDETEWSSHGRDRVAFLAAANAGGTPQPIAKTLSGGELARFMLALKVVLAEADPVPTLVFDEVDSGIGGATAAAVGERLGMLGGASQVLVVTHSPQVAARADHQYRVSKLAGDDVARTTVEPLDDDARREEIARMLSAAEVTEEARAQAARLLVGSAAAGKGAA